MAQSDDILTELKLTPEQVPELPAQERNKLVGFLLRWEHNNAAQRCLQQLLVTDSHRVTVYDALARAHLVDGQPTRALELMRRRHALGVSNSSRALEARAHLEAGDLKTAQAISDQLVDEHPDLLVAWDLQAEVRLTAGDLDGAESALQQRETLRPGMAFTALGVARVWQARGDLDKALLWARTALSRTQRDERQPSVRLLHLLEGLYQATNQPAQAEATAEQLRQRQRSELEDLRQTLDLGLPEDTPAAPVSPAPTADEPPVEVTFDYTSGVISGALELTTQEQIRLDDALHNNFDFEGFRPGQTDAIAASLRGESVLAVMPTGAGKSLCYQLASILLPGTTLVISPLIALMKDQLDGLPAGVARQATTLNSTLEGTELDARLARTAEGGYKMLYAAPERLRQRPFLHTLKRAQVSLLVVDEAHCVSLWGHDFRPDYHFIASAWRELGQPPILGMTATATPRVRDDIQSALSQMRLVAVDVHRPNLRLEARQFAKDSEKQRALLALCQEIKGSGIVYASSRKKCEDLATMLRRHGVKAIHYHAGIRDRAATQDRFMRDEARVVVATIAFGMGIDKADVRFVIHYSPPKALENYYQEAGRAGRDGLPARCILFFSNGDKANLTRWTHQGALHREFLQRVYATLRRWLGKGGVGLVSLADLERELGDDPTHLRVAVHFLETAGLVQRGFDLPRAASLTLVREPNEEDAQLARFIETARLRQGQNVTRNLMAVCTEAELDPRTLEANLLQWHDDGWLRYHGTGRDMLLELPPPPPDSGPRVDAMLAEYRAGQDGRVAEIMAYATTTRCRHGHISAYFGGRPIERCESCDNCLGLSTRQAPARPQRAPSKPRPAGPPVATMDAARTVVEGVTRLPYPLGSTGLAKALQGAGTSSIGADRFQDFGALAGWTQVAIRQLIAQLLEEDFLEQFEKNSYPLLQLGNRGQQWLEGKGEAPTSLAPPKSKAVDGTRAEEPAGYDENLFQQLRTWRLEVAREAGRPPYAVFHDKTLKAIATQRPTSLDELLAIKGIGPAKLEAYGKAVLAIVKGQDHPPA